MNNYDFIIAGAGVVGVAVALELKSRWPKQSVLIIDKEPAIGAHASGRNSGVLHAGFYYTADSLKARFTREGNQIFHDFCEAEKLAVRKCGKLVIATDETEERAYSTLLERAQKNGVELFVIDEKQAHEIEPRARIFNNKALYSPRTSSVNPKEVLTHLQKKAEHLGVNFAWSEAVLKRESSNTLKTTKGKQNFGHFINSAGLYADRIAHSFQVGLEYEVLPFRGFYLYSSEPTTAYRAHIYPVPNLANPFLGVHFTLTVDGHCKIGPTALPGLWREQYGGLSGFQWSEFFQLAARNSSLMLNSDFNFKQLAMTEIQNLLKSQVVKKAQRLAKNIEIKNFTEWGPVGIRAQLMKKSDRKLEMDFVIRSGENSTHILNAVSPGWTCAFPFAKHVVSLITS